ncbi:MAG: ABC transporter permease [Candidatus Hydrogenedentes bacterium]|nr:ABC transporter permease [Candidatus Hydrogenedentota bacterium]
MSAILGYPGRIALDALHAGGMVCVLVVDTLNWLLVQPLRGKGLRVRSVIEHFVEFGVRSMPIVGLICFLVGVIIAMQSAYTLEKWGATKFIANLVGISALRELAPLMTAVLITGRCGSAITAEIGTMKVAEEIDALHVMGLNPTKFLIVPKFLAMLLAVPCVTVLAMFIMILGGFLLSCSPLVGVDPVIYYEQTANALVAKDMVTGLVKSVFFGITICWVGIYRGFQVEGGAEGVGRKTTSSVVTSIFLIILLDLVWTTLFYFA